MSIYKPVPSVVAKIAREHAESFPEYQRAIDAIDELAMVAERQAHEIGEAITRACAHGVIEIDDETHNLSKAAAARAVEAINALRAAMGVKGGAA